MCNSEHFLIIAVQCSEGTYFSDVTEKCEHCPKGEYQDQRAQTSCLSCGTDMTTPTFGAVAASECIGKIEV